ncbi:MAG: 1-phosphofructokinase [Solirubrobacteraceae bacterium]|nr:1-phosphofructokinase [Solirubrobacteraceae bacterium]
MVIAGPNLTIDRTLTIDELRPGEVLRFERVVVTPGGKGVNVARVARELAWPAVLVGFVPGHTGVAGAALLRDEGIDLTGVAIAGELRSTAVILERGGRVTVFNEPGPPLAPGDWERFEAAIDAALDRQGVLGGSAVLACSGSLPPAAPGDAYARLVGVAHRRGALAVVDVAGAQLAAALGAGADVVTPNLAEAEGLLHGRADETVEAGDPRVVRERALAAARELVARGAAHAVVTAAAAGAAVADGSGARWLDAAQVDGVGNPIGAGDAFVGGLAVALERGEDMDRAVVHGMATAAASVETETAGVVDPARVAALGVALRAAPGSAPGAASDPAPGGA